jgi:hypothetical protein
VQTGVHPLVRARRVTFSLRTFWWLSLAAALPHVELQLELPRRRLDQLRELEADLVVRGRRLLRRRRELGGG